MDNKMLEASKCPEQNSPCQVHCSTNCTFEISPRNTQTWCKENSCGQNPLVSDVQVSLKILQPKEEDIRAMEACCDGHTAILTNLTSPIHPTYRDDHGSDSCHSHGKDPKIKTICGLHLKRRGNLGESGLCISRACGRGNSNDLPIAPHVMEHFSNSACCTQDALISDSDKNAQSTSPASPEFPSTELASVYSFAPVSEEVDIERESLQREHIILQVLGMDCTSCEKKLFRILTSMPEVSRVKTSFLLAQAEFDLRSTDYLNAGNIANHLQKLSGFACTKVVHAGAQLELIVQGDTKAYDECWPSSVSELTVLTKNRIRISYHPRSIGARELLADPLFQNARLAPPSPSLAIVAGQAHFWKSFYMTLFATACTIPVLILAWAQLPEHVIVYGAVSLALASMVQVVVAGPFYISAAKALIFSRSVEIELLIVLSTTTAYIYSIVAYTYLTVGRPLDTGEFFETGTLLVTLIMVGRTVSSLARQRALESIAIESLQMNTAVIINEDGEMEVDARLLQYMDVFKVLPDMSIVTDGIIMTGESEVDESLITGETTLAYKRPGDTVIAGSVNYSGILKVQVTRLPYENTIKIIGAMVNQAKSTRPKVQELADRIASYFVPVILALTVVVFITWVAIGKLVRQNSTSTSCVAAMTYAISVLIVSCPCAVGLAVPMVVVIAGGVGARHGLVFKTAETIDIARKVNHVVFDKTGTLTQNKLQVIEQAFIKDPSCDELAMILGLTANSKHPIAQAVASHLRALQISPEAIDHIVSHPGKGLSATFQGRTIKAGNPYWLNVEKAPQVCKILSAGLSLFCIVINDTLIAVYGLRDLLRPDAVTTIASLQKSNISISLISGDTAESVHLVAAELGIPSSNVLARCTPTQKRDYVASLLASPKAVVLFCGDGTNDAPSLAQASIGVHMNDGTEVAANAADVIIMRPSLQGIVTLMALSQAVHRRILFNFGWSAVYNIAAVLLAAGAFPNARIPPQYAGLGEIVSVMPVIAVAVGLKWKKL